ncbi:hypothetical protein GUJ93_ZPchr0008g13662 [Zizania palustris]|uniref:Uncharacterized protein n=1 Tax=Zizania palustris TaxID=103762 RepID=A0A8J5RJN5_ZIZPA|nr:hypothetical protein GUJ93_ZPchr0008g13662 [Zizania palustris]
MAYDGCFGRVRAAPALRPVVKTTAEKSEFILVRDKDQCVHEVSNNHYESLLAFVSNGIFLPCKFRRKR